MKNRIFIAAALCSLLAAASEQYPPVRERRGKSVDVSVEHVDRVPGATGIVFGCPQWFEPVGLAAQKHDFIARYNGTMATARSRKVRQTLNHHLLPLCTVRSGDNMPSGLSRGA